MAVIPELLAPAGEWESFMAAVGSGADAVYIGGKAFSARQSAGNFDMDGIGRAVRHAHLLGVRVYVTVNTLIDASELRDALLFIRDVAELGIDAVIIQDMGLLHMARILLPNVEMHASTQMTVHNSGTTKALGDMGISRVVLAREMSLAEISAIKANTGVELEVFTHGALCICYSGQCLMSSVIGGRSGNRGRCAQPCRLEYDLVDLDGGMVPVSGHLLSPKDLNASALLPELIRAGVDSLKIEGRMKRPEYVATVTRVYRNLLDNPGGSEGESGDLLAVFNRGVTTHYLEGKSGPEMMGYNRPSNRGTYLGRVMRNDFGSRSVDIKLEADLSVGDGVEVWVSQGGRAATEVRSLMVNGTPVQQAAKGQVASIELEGRIRPGDRAFKTRDSEIIERAREAYASRGAARRVRVRAEVGGGLGEPLSVRFVDEDGHSGSANTDKTLEVAQKRPLNAEYVLDQLSRTGNTLFQLESISFGVGEGLIVPVSSLNEARRQALADLEEARLRKALPPGSVGLPSRDALAAGIRTAMDAGPINKPMGDMGLIVQVSSVEEGRAAASAGADGIRLDLGSRRLSRMGEKILDPLKALAKDVEYIGLVLPAIIHDDEMPAVMSDVDRITQTIPDCRILTGNPGALRELAERGLNVELDHGLGLYNNMAARSIADAVRGWGGRVEGIHPSLELTFRQLGGFTAGLGPPVEAMAHGAMRLMVSEHCFIGSLVAGCGSKGCAGACEKGRYGIRDRMGMVFPLASDRFCRGYVLNSKDLCMIGNIRDFHRCGVARLRLELGDRPIGHIGGITKAYRKELDSFNDDPQGYAFDEDVKSGLEELSPNGFTKGHYFRGVMGV